MTRNDDKAKEDDKAKKRDEVLAPTYEIMKQELQLQRKRKNMTSI